MDLFPAIDLRGGRVVQLVQGDYGRERVYGDDPVGVATAYAAAGARWLHVVDLDAARTGEPVNRELVGAIAAAVEVPVQTSGGIRDVAAAEAVLALGVARVVIGTAAVEDPGLVRRLTRRHPGRVAVGLDGRGREVAVKGWSEAPGADLLDLARRYDSEGVAALVVTEISRDGMLGGPDMEGVAAVLEVTGVDVVASGGVSSLDDLRGLAALDVGGRRLAGAIVGTALYEGRFTVEEAIAALA